MVDFHYCHEKYFPIPHSRWLLDPYFIFRIVNPAWLSKSIEKYPMFFDSHVWDSLNKSVLHWYMYTIYSIFDSITLKNVAKTWEVEVARSMKDRNVLIPPLRTAGPILFKAWTDLACLVPKNQNAFKKIAPLWVWH